MNDEHFATYLRNRAGTIDVPMADPAVIATRARDRRHRRHVRAARVAGAVVVLGASATALAISSDGSTPVESTPLGSQPSPFDWEVVDPTPGTGLGYADLPVALDGALFSLSTAPGPADLDDAETWRSNTLYRSTDGREWETLDLPDDLYASSLAADSGRLYAVGTGPVGGEGVPLRLASSPDGGATWTTADIPDGLDELEARYPGEIVIGPPSVASVGGTTVVSMAVSAAIDVERRLPEGIEAEGGWSTSPTGVEIYGPGAPCEAITPTAGDDAGFQRCEPEAIATYTWEELGVPADLAALTTAEVRLYAATGDGAFEPVPAPSPRGNSPTVRASATGFTLLQQAATSFTEGGAVAVEVHTSTDGRTWTRQEPLAGYLEGSGRLRDALGVATRDASGVLRITILGDDGSRTSVDPLASLPAEILVTDTYTGSVGFGPLGWAVLAVPADEGPRHVIHSDPAGTTAFAVAVPAALDGVYDAGISVSADAITVRFVPPGDDDPETIAPQRLLVGIPSGP